jgi:drug/metabolite transporter (DMT)-like permease
MFVGEFMCMIPFLLKPWISRLRGRPTYESALVYSPLPQQEEAVMDDSDHSDVEEHPTGNPDHKPLIPHGNLPMTGLAQLLFLFPAVCDIAGTTLMNVGLILTPVSIYQMSRGALVLWVGILSVVFLGRRLRAYQWSALVVVMLGVALVGLAGSMVKKSEEVGGEDTEDGMAVVLFKRLAVATAEMVAPEDPTKVFIGVLLITGAQIFTATQFVSNRFPKNPFRC